MKVAVTGAAGFIGRHLVHELAASGHGVVTVSRRPAPIPGAERHCPGDVREEDTWRRVGPVEAIVHLAGYSDASLSHGQAVEYNTANAVGTLVGLEAARRSGSLFILASSQRVYRSLQRPVVEDDPLEPVDPYGYSKLVAEQWVAMYHRVFGLPTVVLRFFSVYGPGQLAGAGSSGVVALFANRALRGEDLVVHGQAWRDFTYVGDVVRGISLALGSRRAVGETYNVATGTATSVAELARLVLAVTGSRSAMRVAHEDRVGESYVASVAKARAHLGYEATVGLRQGLEHYVEWLRARG